MLYGFGGWEHMGVEHRAHTSRNNFIAQLGKLISHCLGVLQHLLLVGLELWLGCLLEGTGQASNGVVVGTSLNSPSLVSLALSQRNVLLVFHAACRLMYSIHCRPVSCFLSSVLVALG